MADAAGAGAGAGAEYEPPGVPGEAQPVSFTDANNETGQTGANADNKAGASAMLNLIGDIKKKKATAEKSTAEKSEDQEKTDASSKATGQTTTGGGKKKKKKNKKKNKKGKKKRKVDRFESQNYLLRIEGSICCATIIMVLFMVVINIVVLAYVSIASGGQMNYVYWEQKLEENK